METALTVLLWLAVIVVALYVLFAIVGAIAGAVFFRKATKDFDDDFFKKHRRF